jgi:hypothetical protein
MGTPRRVAQSKVPGIWDRPKDSIAYELDAVPDGDSRQPARPRE